MRGELVDFNRMPTIQKQKPALGGSRLNASGDLLDATGKVLRTQSQIEQEMRDRNVAQSAQINIKQTMTSEQLAATLKKPSNALPTVEAQRPQRRRQVDTDE